jgi:ribosomal protein L32
MTEIATCPDCGQIMTPDNSCLPLLRDEAGNLHERIPFGAEPDFGEVQREFGLEVPATCYDCDCAIGKFHHYHCNHEVCPKCGGQLLSCYFMAPEHHQPGEYPGGGWVGPEAAS